MQESLNNTNMNPQYGADDQPKTAYENGPFVKEDMNNEFNYLL
jgi:hypothetical protein